MIIHNENLTPKDAEDRSQFIGQLQQAILARWLIGSMGFTYVILLFSWNLEDGIAYFWRHLSSAELAGLLLFLGAFAGVTAAISLYEKRIEAIHNRVDSRRIRD